MLLKIYHKHKEKTLYNIINITYIFESEKKYII